MAFRWSAVAIGSSFLVLAPAPALADQDDGAPSVAVVGPVDTVHLRDGNILRGRLTEIVPEDHVTLLLVGGTKRRIEWSDLTRVVSGTASDTAGIPQAASPAPMEGPRVFVHIESSSTMVLYRRPVGSSDLVRACESPCDTELPLGDTYKIGGGGSTSTGDFRLAGRAGQRIELSVRGTSWLGILGGGLVASAGIGSTYIGVILVLIGTAKWAAKGVLVAGIGATLGGVGLVVGGAFIILHSMKTGVSQESRTAGVEAFVRSPSWPTAIPSAEIPLPRATFPALFERTF